jgi:hypothetical protein
MAEKGILFGVVTDISGHPLASVQDPGKTSAVSVRFETGAIARLPNVGAAFEASGAILKHARQYNLPVHVELRPGTDEIVNVRLPFVGIVTKIDPTKSGDIEIQFAPSHAYHYLKKVNPGFQRLREALESAKNEQASVFVTETLEEGIIDVRPAAGPFGLAWSDHKLLRKREAEALALTLSQAQGGFEQMVKQSCSTVSPSAPLCIPFLYPRDGCYARAHQMCKLLAPLQPTKAWNYGKLRVATSNDPSCAVTWVYHVAPVLNVQVGGTVVPHVIDPAIFSEIVPLQRWRQTQGDQGSVLVSTEAQVYYRDPDGRTMLDPIFQDTESRLHYFQGELLSQIHQYGPMPYLQCRNVS